MPDVQFTLYHVLSGPPQEFWDEGHIFPEKERASGKALEAQRLANQGMKFDPLLQTAREMLARHTIAPEQIAAKYAAGSIAGAPDCIVAGAKTRTVERAA
jgi:hypothetical protein